MQVRSLPSAHWIRPELRKLSHGAQLLVVYLKTCPESHVSGLFRLPAILVAHQFRVSEDEALGWLSELSNHVAYDSEIEFCFVRDMLAEQPGRKSELITKAVQRQLAQIPSSSPLVAEFFKHYPEYKKNLDTASKGLQRGIEGASKGLPRAPKTNPIPKTEPSYLPQSTKVGESGNSSHKAESGKSNLAGNGRELISASDTMRLYSLVDPKPGTVRFNAYLRKEHLISNLVDLPAADVPKVEIWIKSQRGNA